MARKRFLVLYPDRSKKHVTSEEREQMYLEGVLTRTADPRIWHYTGQQHTFHSFAELEQLIPSIQTTKHRRFLPGNFKWEHKGITRRELLETPENMAARLAHV